MRQDGRRFLAAVLKGEGGDVLLVADRNFYSWQAWDTAAATGAALLWRAPTPLTLPVLRVLPRPATAPPRWPR